MAVIATIYPFTRLGSEFMPPLYEEDLLYMPITVPGISVEEAKRLLQWQDAQIKKVPEVDRVFGKAGRAETSLDPAPLSMFETIVHLKPRDRWRSGVKIEGIIAELERVTRTPGVQGAWTMPIKARIDMLSTGIRTPIGVKVFGPDLGVITTINDELERVLRTQPHTRSVYAERELGGFFLDVTPDRETIARYGLSVRDVLDVVESSIGGMDVATTYEGRERFKINVRYPRELRDNLDAIRNILVPIAPLRPRRLSGGSTTPGGAMEPAAPAASPGMAAMGAQASSAPAGEAMPSDGRAAAQSPGSPAASAAFVPLGQLATIEPVMGAPMIKSEMGQITGWTYVDIDSSDVGGYVRAAKQRVDREVKIPVGYFVKWTGQYELLERVTTRMTFVLPLTILIVFAILYINFRGAAQALIVMASVPFAAVGAIWTLWLFGFNTSIAVWVGMIALLGVAAETASVMVVYLDEAWVAGRANGTINTVPELAASALAAGTKRVRPMLMTVMTNVFGLMPILLDDGVGSDVAKRIAAPMWGGLVSLTLLTLLVIPAIYVVWRSFHLGPSMAPTGTLGEKP